MIHEPNENIIREKQNRTKQILELKNTVSELKNFLKGFYSRLDQAEERISKLKDRSFEIIESKEQKGKRIKNGEESLRDLWDTIKGSKIHIIGVAEEEREKRADSAFKEIMAANFPNLGKELDIQIHEAKNIPNRNLKKSTLT